VEIAAMRRWKFLLIDRVPREVREALEDWAGILFAIGIALLLLATLQAQLARADEVAGSIGARQPLVSPRVPLDRDLVIAPRPLVGSSPAVAAPTATRGDTTHAARQGGTPP
jgi:hypothetical protein